MTRYLYNVKFTVIRKDDSRFNVNKNLVAKNDKDVEAKIVLSYCNSLIRNFEIISSIEIPDLSSDYAFEESDDPRTAV